MSSETGTDGAIATRLRDVRSELGLTQSEIADRVDKSQQSWANYESGHSTPPLEVVKRLVEELGISGDWLIAGYGDMKAGMEEVRDRKEPHIYSQIPGDFDVDDVTFAPVYGAPLGAGSAGNAAMVKARGYMAWEKKWLRREARIEPNKAFVAQVYGQSMEDLLQNGDLVLGEFQDIVDHDGIYAVRVGDQLLIKHAVRSRHRLTLVSENEVYGTREITEQDDFNVIGRIVARVGGL